MRWLLLATLTICVCGQGPWVGCENNPEICEPPYLDQPQVNCQDGPGKVVECRYCTHRGFCHRGLTFLGSGTPHESFCACAASPLPLEGYRAAVTAVTQDFASDDMPLVLGIAIGVPLGAAYIAVHNRVLAV